MQRIDEMMVNLLDSINVLIVNNNFAWKNHDQTQDIRCRFNDDGHAACNWIHR